MKKLLILLAVVITVSILPLAAFADGDGHDWGEHHDREHHDQDWRDHHDRDWRDHDQEWRHHDREWRDHRGDRHWREEHARMWGDWYRWHRDNESVLNINVAVGPDGGPNLDIDFSN